jgi:hypothetical protein
MKEEKYKADSHSPSVQDREPLIYVQDCEFYRHQDVLMLGRFQTVAVTQGAMLYGLYELELRTGDRRLLLGAGIVLSLLIILLTLKDGSDGRRHLVRIRRFESGLPLERPRFLGGGRRIMLAASTQYSLPTSRFCAGIGSGPDVPPPSVTDLTCPVSSDQSLLENSAHWALC